MNHSTRVWKISALLALSSLAILIAPGAALCQSAAKEQPEATSLFGRPLYRLEIPSDDLAKLEADLKEARAGHDQDPTDPDRIIWLGRRLSYLWRYRDAIDVYTRGVGIHPANPRLYRHRGHRYITIRDFDKAIADLQKASQLIAGMPDEVEPDGAPNPAKAPRSTLHFNIWYHLGLAHYLKGDFENARRSYIECMKVSTNDDLHVATADWLYMTYRRMGLDAEAGKLLETIREKMEILENQSYHKRLLMYKGLISPEELLRPEGLTPLDLATQGYGVANWHYYSGERKKARSLLEQILDGPYWAAFGYIAAEADLKRWPEG